MLLASCFLLPASAFGAPADLGEIEVRETSEHESEQAPSSFTTVILPSKYDSENKSMTEIVSESPGVQSKELGGPGQYSTVTIRGSSAEQVTILIDGIRINTEQGGGVDFSSIPVAAIERIEVIRGGGTAVFGPDAIGGVINIITKKAREGRQIEIKETFGSFATFKSSEAWRERHKKWGFVLSHTHAQSRGDYTFRAAKTDLAGTTIGGGGIFTRIHNGFISEDVLTKFDISATDDLKFQISNNFFFTKRQVPGLEDETTVLYPANPLEAEETIFRNLTSASARAVGLFDDHLSVEAGVTNNLNTDHFTDPSPAIGTAIDRYTFGDSINPYLLLEPSFSNKVFTNLVTLRYDFRRDLFHDSSPIPNTQLIGSKGRSTHGIFFQDEISFARDRVTLVPAARYEKASDSPSDTGLKIGVAVRPWRPLTLKGNIETSFRYPNFNELYFPDQGYIRGNPSLNKEEAINWDAGFSVKVDKDEAGSRKQETGNTELVYFELSYFRNDIKNQIIWVPVSATTIQPINTYNVDAYGIEIASTVNPIKFLTVEANYTWLSAHFESNNLQLPGRPRHKINTRADVHHDFNDTFGGSIFGRLQYVSALPVNTQNTVFIAERTTVDIGVTARLSPKNKRWGAYALTFETKDITNVQIYDARGFPLPRRSFFVTLGIRWA